MDQQKRLRGSTQAFRYSRGGGMDYRAESPAAVSVRALRESESWVR